MKTRLTAPGATLLCASLVLFVYRFAVAGVNLSLFRTVFLAWLGLACLDVIRRRIRLERAYWPSIAMVAGILVVNAVDFATLAGHPALRRDIANHLVNLALAGLVLIYARTEPDRRRLLRAFAWSSVVTTYATIHAAVFDRVPFESAIRAAGSELGRSLAYISTDGVFERATSTFFDPNFYGIYSMLVLVAIVYLWLFDGARRDLAILFAINLLCLELTLSRTAVVGVLVLAGLTFMLARRARVFAVAVALTTVGALYGATAFQSNAYAAGVRDRVATWWHTWRQDEAAAPRRTTGEPANPAGPEGSGPVPRTVESRVTDARSLRIRLDYIERGLTVFQSSPIWGRGSASLVTEDVQWSSAHVTYLTLLARYGILGASVYFSFLLYPLALVWRRGVDPGHRFLVTTALVPLMAVYLSYDVFLFFEIQYVFFGLAFSAALESRRNGA